MTRIPKLHETAAEAREPEVSENLAPLAEARAETRARLTQRRRWVAGAVMGLILVPTIVKGAIDSYGYGYHPDKNLAAHQGEAGK